MEPLHIFDPRRNMHVQGFSGRAATATIHDATATGLSISGVFQAPEDFAVLCLDNAYDYFNHLRTRPLPRTDLTGLRLQFDLEYDHDLPANAGYACFVDESFCDLPHVYAGSAARLCFTRNWAFHPEFLYAKSPGVDHDYKLIAKLSRDFGPFRRARPYCFFRAGAQLHRGRYGAGGWGPISGGGFGVKAYVSKSVLQAPEVRLGWEPFLRLGMGVGYTFGKP